jgi:hypothetical protein
MKHVSLKEYLKMDYGVVMKDPRRPGRNPRDHEIWRGHLIKLPTMFTTTLQI